jgi:tetratricopeptide (TPR) repeat protein
MKIIKSICLFLWIQFSFYSSFSQNFQKIYLKGIEAYQKGNYPEAVMQFEKCLKGKSPDSALVFNALGDVYSYWQNYAPAIDYYKRALDAKFSHPEQTYFMLSSVYYNKKEFKTAMDYCLLILEKNPSSQDARVFWRLNLIYSLKDEKDNAVNILKKGAKNGIHEFQIYCETRSIQWK